MPNTTSTLIDLGAHAVEISDAGILIASHPESAEIPIREVVELSQDEALKLYSVLRARYPLEPGLDDDHAESSIYVPSRLVRGWKAAAALASTPDYHWSADAQEAGVEEHGDQ